MSLWYIRLAIMDIMFISCVCFFLRIIFKFKLKYVSCKAFLQNAFVLFFSHVSFNLSLIYMKCREQFNWITKLINWNELLPLILYGLLHIRLWIFQFYDNVDVIYDSYPLECTCSRSTVMMLQCLDLSMFLYSVTEFEQVISWW